MKTREKARMLLVAVVLVVGACQPAQETVERQQQSLMFWNPTFVQWPMELIGRGLNGIALNGEPLEGQQVVAVSLEGVVVGNGAPKDLTLKRTLFRGSHAHGKSMGNRDMEGALLVAFTRNGLELTLRIDAALEAEDPELEYFRYEVSYLSLTGWRPLCGTTDDGEPIPAIPLNGLWDYRSGVEGGGSWQPSETAFTFACEGFILAKCVSMGYAPWAEGKLCDPEVPGGNCEKMTLAGHHQACTRALRADYCGDGMSHTVNDIVLNLYDGIGISVDADDWVVEAEWDENGARCLVAERLPDGVEPLCAEALDLPDCGAEEHFSSGTRIVTEFGPEEL